MRSRYTAFAKGLTTYLERTWHPSTRPAEVTIRPDQVWTGLEILSTQAGAAEDDEGVVEFVARYEVDGRSARLHEVSRFERDEDAWVYTEAVAGSRSAS